MPNHETSARADRKFAGDVPVILCDACATHHAEHCDSPFTCRDIEALRQDAYASGMARMREMAAQVAEDRFAENADSRYYEICSQKAEAIRKLGVAPGAEGETK